MSIATKFKWLAAGVTCAWALCAPPAKSGPLERAQAKRIHDRLAGVPPSAAVLNQMEALILANDELGAANLAMENPAFYNVTLKNFVTPWTNREQTVFAPLNDYTATVIGMVRDDEPFEHRIVVALQAEALELEAQVRHDLRRRGPHHVLLVQPQQLLVVECGSGLVDVVDVERGDHLLTREHFLVAV